MRRAGWILAAVVGVLLLAFVSVVVIRHINGPRVVGRSVTPDGVEMCVVQRCNWSGEPFTTSFYCRYPGSNWAWFYYDHQDWYWGYSEARLDTNAQVVVFYRGTNVAIRYAWAKRLYWRGDRLWATGAQSYLTAGKSPF